LLVAAAAPTDEAADTVGLELNVFIISLLKALLKECCFDSHMHATFHHMVPEQPLANAALLGHAGLFSNCCSGG